MERRKKTLALVLCALLLIMASVAGTVAYLTSTPDSITNTFSVGDVVITLDETDVDVYGVKDGDTPVVTNAYKLLPGHTYTKDPTVHVKNSSEDCYIFVKVVNDISALEADKADVNDTIAQQITGTNSWTELPDVANVYYKQWTKDTTKGDDDYIDLPVFGTFTVSSSLGKAELEAYKTDKTVTITAYAIQKNGISDAKAAWIAGNFS